MKQSFERKWIITALGLTLLLMGINNFISYRNAKKLFESAERVKHTNEVLKSITDISTTLIDAESSERTYLISGDKSQLKGYNIALQSIEPKIKSLQQLIAANPRQQRQIAALQLLNSQRLALFKQSINFYQSSKSALSAPPSLVAQNKRNQNNILSVIVQIQNEEEQLLKTWIEQLESSTHNRMRIELFSTMWSFAILYGLYILLHQQMIKRHQAEVVQQTLAQEKTLSNFKLRFLSMVSHEFRTLLSIILGSAQLLTENSQQWTETKKLKNLYRIQASAKLMTKLLTDILTLTRAEAGKLECHPVLIDLESFCLNLVEDIQFSSETQHSIKFVSSGQCTHAYLDEKLLYSILSNLLSNALKYSRQGGKIDFILSSSPEAVIFQVKDEGIGIPLESQQALYEPFSRCHNVGNIVGSGLGLAVVKECIELHQGQIYMESEEGIGTTFTVKLPIQSK